MKNLKEYTMSNGKKILIDESSIVSIMEHDSGSAIMLAGDNTPKLITEPYETFVKRNKGWESVV